MTTNSFNVSTLVAGAMTEFYVDGNPLYNTSNRKYVATFSQKTYATGGTVDIKVPAYPTTTYGLAVTPEGIQDLIIPYTITTNDIYNITRELDLYQETFDLLGGTAALTKPQKMAIVDNYAYPAYQSLAAAMELNAATKLSYTAYLSPIDGIEKLGSINTYSDVSALGALMTNLKLDTMERYLMMNVDDANQVFNSLQNMFNESINGNITEERRVGGPEKGRLAGFDLYQSSDMPIHISGPLAGVSGITVSSIDATGTLLTLTGVSNVTSQLVNAGDRISIPSVNLMTSLNQIQLSTRLVVTAALPANGDGAGNVQVTLSYPLMATGEHINVASLPAMGAAVNVFPNYRMNFAYVPSGLSFVPLMLPPIYGATNSDTKGDNKCPVHVYQQGQVSAFTNIFRISALVGIQPFAPYVIAFPSKA